MNALEEIVQHNELRDAAENLLFAWSQILSTYISQWASLYPDPVTPLSYCVMFESLTRLAEFVLSFRGGQPSTIAIIDHGSLDHYWVQRCRQNRLCPQRVESLLSSRLS